MAILGNGFDLHVGPNTRPRTRPKVGPGRTDQDFPRTAAELAGRIGYTPHYICMMEDAAAPLDDEVSVRTLNNVVSGYTLQSDTPFAGELGLFKESGASSSMSLAYSGDNNVLEEHGGDGDDVFWLLVGQFPAPGTQGWLVSKYEAGGTYGYAAQCTLAGEFGITCTNNTNTVTGVSLTPRRGSTAAYAVFLFGYSITNGVCFTVYKQDGVVTSDSTSIAGMSTGEMNNDAYMLTSLQAPCCYAQWVYLAGFDDALTLPQAEEIVRKF